MTLNPWKRITQLKAQMSLIKGQLLITRIERNEVTTGYLNLVHDVKNVIASLDGVTNGTAIRVRRELKRAIEEAN